MSKALRSRFLSIEDQFLSSITLGSDAIAAFNHDWASLFRDFSAAVKSQQVDDETMTMAHTIASRVAILADPLLCMDSEMGKLLEDFESEVDRILSDGDVEVSSSHLNHPPPSPPTASQSANHKSDSSPSLHSTARHWLLHNLHDPYPSPSQTASLAGTCGCAVKVVQDWFSSARRRIGWTDLSREKFNGSRRETSRAAARVYVEDSDESLPLDITRAFSVIRANAQNLLQEVVADSDEDVELADSKLDVQGFDYCLPALPVVEDDEDDMTPPPPIAGCKRTFGSTRESEDSGAGKMNADVALDSRPSKRHRSFKLTSSSNQVAPFTSQNQSVATQYPFSFDGIGQVPMSPNAPTKDIHPSFIPAEEVVSSSSTSPRKRRLSDASSAERPKRPRGLDHGPRRQTVSDPLPSASGVLFSEDWLNAAFGVPSAIDTKGLEAPSPFDIGLYEHNSITHSHDGTIVVPTCQFDISDADLATAVVNLFDLSFTSTSQPTTSQSECLDSPSLPVFEEPFDLSEYQSVSDSLLDWSQFDDIVRSLGTSSPTPSLTSLSSDSSASSTPNPLSDDSSLQIGYPPEADPTALSSCLSDLSNELPSLLSSSEHVF
ncbi:hypothetical protein EVG20_g9930 [Dentipellis fragilis]|uniref:Homeobox KN domain-containing protein n=1 Tax=Dentipellis fragilis TaxID=205917 RepID=A0A4Y9XUQ8_9AGAM|nr:hypothetical protein EVG20_g9930 [Dentipellis fragilis]